MNTFKFLTIVLSSIFILAFGHVQPSHSGVEKVDGKTYLIDRTGERWDITQAVGIGFNPRNFEFGIGRNTIRPLDDTSLTDGTEFKDFGARVIGVENGDDAHAYVVLRLTRHEIANTQLGEKPIAAAY